MRGLSAGVYEGVAQDTNLQTRVQESYIVKGIFSHAPAAVSVSELIPRFLYLLTIRFIPLHRVGYEPYAVYFPVRKK